VLGASVQMVGAGVETHGASVEMLAAWFLTGYGLQEA